MTLYNNIEWTNPNPGPITTTIYRATAPIVSTALPAPLVQFENDTTSYQDQDVVLGTTYYYVLAFTNTQGQSAYSRNYEYTSRYALGPGEAFVLKGDQLQGYMGSVEMPFSMNELLSAMGTTNQPNASKVAGYKLIIDNQVLYVTVARHSFSLFPGMDLTTLTGDGILVKLDGLQYRVRLPKNFNELSILSVGLWQSPLPASVRIGKVMPNTWWQSKYIVTQEPSSDNYLAYLADGQSVPIALDPATADPYYISLVLELVL